MWAPGSFRFYPLLFVGARTPFFSFFSGLLSGLGIDSNGQVENAQTPAGAPARSPASVASQRAEDVLALRITRSSDTQTLEKIA